MFEEYQEKLFLDEIKKGINLFLGSGFSVLEDKYGNKLPTASQLCDDIYKEFDIDRIYGNDLYTISELAPSYEYQNYLRKMFMVSENSINELYYSLDYLNIKSIITTNIDNIVPRIFERSKSRHYLSNVSKYGAAHIVDGCIKYVPINGDVCDKDSHLYFGKFDLSLVKEKNQDLCNTALSLLFDNPVLFWGYSFVDSSVKTLVKKLLDQNKQANIWVQCMPEDEKQIKFFKSMGCKIIVCDTLQLFKWVDENHDKIILDDVKSDSSSILSKIVDYRVPKLYSYETNEKNDYYQKGATCWYSIHNNHPYETPLVDELWALLLNYKNILVLGASFSGKTTALMQCAAKRNAFNVFYFYGTETKEEIKKFLDKISDNTVVAFLQDCTKDIELFCLLAECKNVKLIASADKYSFENVRHIVEECDIVFKEKYIGDIEKETARRIYGHIPPDIVSDNFVYKENNDEEYSFLELCGKNIKGFISYESVLKILSHICEFEQNTKQPIPEIQLVALTVYLESRESLMSTDLFFSFFDFTDYKNQILPLCEKVKGLLTDSTLINADQDYFSIRSKFFLKYAERAFLNDENLRMVYRFVITRFVINVSKTKVFRYDIFRRKAYDSRLFFKLFGKNNINEKDESELALELYNKLYNYDDNPYTLQQKALYLSLLCRSKEAFSAIDDALSYSPNNFSMKNSKAEILFNANKPFDSIQAKEQLFSAISILNDCRKNDKKQNYHAILYAKIALHLYKTYSGDDTKELIVSALDWLTPLRSDNGINDLINQINEVLK